MLKHEEILGKAVVKGCDTKGLITIDKNVGIPEMICYACAGAGAEDFVSDPENTR